MAGRRTDGAPRHARLVLLGALALLSARAMVRAAAPSGVGPTPPPLPPQPGAALAPAGHPACPIAAQPPGSWRRISEAVSATNPFPQQQVMVDPWSPCLLYRATDPQSLDRSVDGGVSWRPSFLHTAAGAFAGSGPAGLRGADPGVPPARGLLIARGRRGGPGGG